MMIYKSHRYHVVIMRMQHHQLPQHFQQTFSCPRGASQSVRLPEIRMNRASSCCPWNEHRIHLVSVEKNIVTNYYSHQQCFALCSWQSYCAQTFFSSAVSKWTRFFRSSQTLDIISVNMSARFIPVFCPLASPRVALCPFRWSNKWSSSFGMWNKHCTKKEQRDRFAVKV